MSRWLTCCLLLVVVGCSKRSPDGTPPERTAPWLASSAPRAVERAPRLVRYGIAAPSNVRFELPARRDTPHGVVDHLTGELSLNLSDLAESTALVRIDLESLRIEGAPDNETATARAHAWLNVVKALPEYEQRRWAELRVTPLAGAAVDQNQLGRAGSADAGARTIVNFQTRATLLLNGVRVERDVDGRAELVRNGASDVPDELWVKTARPLAVPLLEHRIEPRDESGAPAPRDAKALGEAVGRTARVTAELRFVRVGAEPAR